MSELKDETDGLEGFTRMQLEKRLGEVDQRFRHEMRARGFDPDQHDNVAFTAPLAKLYTERENLRREMEALTEVDSLANGSLTQAKTDMSEVKRIMDQSQRAFEGEAWHGPSLMAILEGITALQAAARPLSAAHNIWELVFHIAAWERAGLRRLRGDPANLSDAEDWPTVTDTSEEAWKQTKKTLSQGHDGFQDAISKLDDAGLDRQVAGSKATVYGTLHGIIQHTLYHAGQIAMLKKAITEGEKQ